MALVKCPECGNEVSGKALACPRCGNPRSVKSVTHRTPALGYKPSNDQFSVFIGISAAFLSMAFFNAFTLLFALLIKAFPWAASLRAVVYIVPILAIFVCLVKFRRKMPTQKNILIYFASWFVVMAIFKWLGFLMV